MKKTSSVISVLNLLTSRESVTLAEVVSHCGISERTAYRYVQTILEADIPIAFDRKRRAYMVKGMTAFPAAKLRLDQALVIGIALQLLCRHLTEPQQSIASEAWNKIYERKSQLTRQVRDVVDRALQQESTFCSNAMLVNVVLLEVAASQRLPVEIVRKDEKRTRRVLIRRPSLQFAAGWTLRDLHAHENIEHRLEDIVCVLVE